MLLKMMGIHYAWERCPDLGPKPRQVFVTQSPALKNKVKDYFVKLISPPEATTHSAESENDNREETGRSEEGNGEEGLIGGGYGKRWGSDLPEGFSQLLEEHFPLFITFDEVWISSFLGA